MSSPQQLKERLVEAARYAVLRRLAPSLRHNMAGSLQPVSMMSAMLEKRLLKPELDMPSLVKNSAALNTLSREAALSCMDLMAWLVPKENELFAFDACLQDALALVNTELSFKGMTLVNETVGIDVPLPRSVVRNVVIAAVIVMTDTAVAPANIVLTARHGDNELLIAISMIANDGENMSGVMTTYRDLLWDDVQALAEAESVSLTHTDLLVELRYHLA